MTHEKPYRRLDAEALVRSLEQLDVRIRERFPDAGLARVCQELIGITRENSSRAAAIGRRFWGIWAGSIGFFVVGAAMLALLLRQIDFSRNAADNWYTVIQGFDATLHLIVVIVGAIFFLITMEDRVKRRRALRAINELRSLIHVIDMHQLTKEPATSLLGGPPTPHSPRRTLTPFELGRYLDYCSEMLSLVAKVAVLYAQSHPDPVIVDAVSDVERLTASLSQKIWQKITLVHSVRGEFDTATNASRDGDDGGT